MHILVFFTFDVSFRTWCETGLVKRELLIYKHFIKKGHKVTLFTYGDISDMNYQKVADNIDIIPVYKYLKRPNNKYIRLIQSLFIPLFFKNVFQRVDIYKTNQMYGAWIAVIAKFLYRKKLIVRCGYEYLRNAIRDARNLPDKIIKFIPRYLLESLAYKCANDIIISNVTDGNYINKTFGLDSGNINLIGNFIDTDLFKPATPNMQKNIKKCSILYIGRLHRRKNLLSLLKAIANTEYQLDIVGQGEQEKEIREYAHKNNIAESFLGVFPNDELPKIINQYEVFILPSLYENNPKALLEAMACGSAVIGTDVEGINEIIKHNENGLLCDTNYVSIRNAIDRLMNNDELRQKLRRNARKTVLSEYSLSKLAEKELDLYKNLWK